MALEKTGYTAANQGTTKVKVGIDEDGYIAAKDSEDVVGSKRISFTKVAAENSLEDNTEVIEFFLELANGTQDSLTNTMSVTWGV